MTVCRDEMECRAGISASPASRPGAAALALLLAMLAGCAHRVLPANVSEVPECTTTPAPLLELSAFVLPVAIPADVVPKGTRDTTGLIARRVTATFAPGIQRAADDVLWAKMSVRVFGGTVQGWTRVQSPGLLIQVAGERDTARPQRTSRERAVVDFGPGFLTVTRSKPLLGAVSSMLSVDLLMLPGGMPIDESVVRIPTLWSSSGAPLSAEDIQVQLEPTRHVPGYDLVEADVVLDYLLVPKREPACRGSSRSRVVLIDKDAVRPPLWDVGASESNTPRSRWVGLRDESSGVFRAVFDSPAAAASFANWIRATRSTRIGAYDVGLFQSLGREPLRPLVPVDRAATSTFQPLLPADADRLRAGPLGEP